MSHEQLGMVESQPRARSTDRQTSHDAAKSVRGVTKVQSAILRCYVRHGDVRGLTDVDLQAVYAMRHQQDPVRYPRASESGIRTRRKELEDMGYVEDTGITTRLPSGRRATVFTLSPNGSLEARVVR